MKLVLLATSISVFTPHPRHLPPLQVKKIKASADSIAVPPFGISDLRQYQCLRDIRVRYVWEATVTVPLGPDPWKVESQRGRAPFLQTGSLCAGIASLDSSALPSTINCEGSVHLLIPKRVFFFLRGAPRKQAPVLC